MPILANQIDYLASYPIHFAASTHQPILVKVLKDYYSLRDSLEQRDTTGSTPLISACRSCSLESCDRGVRVVKMLLGEGADIEATDSMGRNPLLFASSYG